MINGHPYTQSDYNAAQVEIARLVAENERLERDNRVLSHKNATSLANNLCPDHRDKQGGKLCLAAGT